MCSLTSGDGGRAGRQRDPPSPARSQWSELKTWNIQVISIFLPSFPKHHYSSMSPTTTFSPSLPPSFSSSSFPSPLSVPSIPSSFLSLPPHLPRRSTRRTGWSLPAAHCPLQTWFHTFAEPSATEPQTTLREGRGYMYEERKERKEKKERKERKERGEKHSKRK